MSEDDIDVGYAPDDWFATLEGVKRFSKDDPGNFIAAIMHEIAGCRVVIELYSKIIFEHVDMAELEKQKGIPIQNAIERYVARLQHLVNFMHEYRKTLDDWPKSE